MNLFLYKPQIQLKLKMFTYFFSLLLKISPCALRLILPAWVTLDPY